MLRQPLRKQKKINNLELKIVSSNVTIEEQEREADKIKLDLTRSESHVNRLMQQIRDHQETIISLHDSASSVVSGHMTFCRIDRKPVSCPSTAIKKQEATPLRLVYGLTQFLQC